MNKSHKLHIFDMDGTILDSMPMWATIASDYLDSYNIPHDDGVNKLIESYTLENAAKYFIKLGLNKTVDEIIKDIYDFSFNKYKYEIPAKPGMIELLKKLHESGDTICLLSASPVQCAKAAFDRLGILNFFNKLLSCQDLETDKTVPETFINVAASLGFKPKDTIVYEDALYSILSAKKAGCNTAAIYDDFAKNEWNEILKNADEIIVKPL
ncbi:HAD family phosphatase [Eubacterium sp. MSJ-13]|uniref:HAD family hydrolase n=1 Tax=Eubacterium sp. MSJ-13 TaxID=2841513 RepID=UPI001C104E77|nr:HAD family phosphatase [Eubacterium sp. MSJ-13]MBU5478846.1 HAD family phosphatase [Eubacterium sp. MSJ-13]